MFSYNLLCLSTCYLFCYFWFLYPQYTYLFKTQSMAIVDHFLDLIEQPARVLSTNQFLFTAFLLWNRKCDICVASILNHQFLSSISVMIVSLFLLSRYRNKGIAHFVFSCLPSTQNEFEVGQGPFRTPCSSILWYFARIYSIAILLMCPSNRYSEFS